MLAFLSIWKVTIILPAVLYRCETWSIVLRKEHKLRMFENKKVRRICGHKRKADRGTS
jgi:hypothetical protein